MKDDLEGLEVFCAREHGRLLGTLYLYLGSREVAEEIAQEALLRVCERWPMQGVRSPTAWVHRVGMNMANSWFRRLLAERRAQRRLGSASQESAVDPVDAMWIRDAIKALPLRQREALLLRYFSDLSVGETAEAMGCAEGTVRALTHQAVSVLRTQIAASEEVSDEP